MGKNFFLQQRIIILGKILVECIRNNGLSKRGGSAVNQKKQYGKKSLFDDTSDYNEGQLHTADKMINV